MPYSAPRVRYGTEFTRQADARDGREPRFDGGVAGTLNVNLHGVIHVARRSLPDLVKSEGSLVNIGSIAAERGIEDLSSYSRRRSECQA